MSLESAKQDAPTVLYWPGWYVNSPKGPLMSMVWPTCSLCREVPMRCSGMCGAHFHGGQGMPAHDRALLCLQRNPGGPDAVSWAHVQAEEDVLLASMVLPGLHHQVWTLSEIPLG